MAENKNKVQKSTYPKISAAVAVCGRKHITSKVLLSFGFNASFIFFKLIYNIIDFGAIVKGDEAKIIFKTFLHILVTTKLLSIIFWRCYCNGVVNIFYMLNDIKISKKAFSNALIFAFEKAPFILQ